MTYDYTSQERGGPLALVYPGLSENATGQPTGVRLDSEHPAGNGGGTIWSLRPDWSTAETFR